MFKKVGIAALLLSAALSLPAGAFAAGSRVVDSPRDQVRVVHTDRRLVGYEHRERVVVQHADRHWVQTAPAYYASTPRCR